MWVEGYDLMVDQQTQMEITDQQTITYESQLKNHRPKLNMLKKLLRVDFSMALAYACREKYICLNIFNGKIVDHFE